MSRATRDGCRVRRGSRREAPTHGNDADRPRAARQRQLPSIAGVGTRGDGFPLCFVPVFLSSGTANVENGADSTLFVPVFRRFSGTPKVE
jgi:hypothetical protein